jgi:FlaA1/EpsC-like NDP-sugar epimerase
MGEPVKIDELARDFIKLSGFELGKDVEIVYTGLRPGEKLHEELLMAEEGLQKTLHEKIFIGKLTAYDREVLFQQLEKLKVVTEKEDRHELESILKILVPTYKPNNNEQRVEGE